MVALTERQIRQRIIRAFIDYDPLVLTLTRPIFTETAAGGVVQTGSLVIYDQKFGYQPFFRRLTDQRLSNPQSYGEDFQHGIDYILSFIPEETDIQEGDLFTVVDEGYLQEGRYRVKFLSKRQWDRQFAVVTLRD